MQDAEHFRETEAGSRSFEFSTRIFNLKIQLYKFKLKESEKRKDALLTPQG